MPLPLDEPAIIRVLFALWQQRIIPLAVLSAAAALPLSQTRAALQHLRDRHCLIEETPHAIELISTGLPCWRDIIEHQSALLHRRLGSRAMILQKTNSTNDLCWRSAEGSSPCNGLVVLAEEQTAGRGRRGNPWLAKPGQSILMSLLCVAAPQPSLEKLTLLLGLACAEGIESILGQPVNLKWPNDVLVAQRKLAGILVETRPSHAHPHLHDIVLGIGINVTQRPDDFPEEIRSRATSLHALTGRAYDRLLLIDAVLTAIEHRCLLLSQNDPASAWLDAWKSRCNMLGSTLQVRAAGSLLQGQILDVDPLQGLVLRDDRGVTHFLSAQTTTISGV